ncbi:MAG: hypothetical protein L3I91_01485 [Mycoplasma sp.]
MTSIGNEAFKDCINLKNIYFNYDETNLNKVCKKISSYSETEWNDVFLDQTNRRNKLNAIIHIPTNTTLEMAEKYREYFSDDEYHKIKLDSSYEKPLSYSDIYDINDVLIKNISKLSDFTTLQFDWRLIDDGLVSCLTAMRSSLGEALNDASTKGSGEITEAIQAQMETVKNIVIYAEKDLPQLIAKFSNILEQLQAGEIDEKLSDSLWKYIRELKNIFNYFDSFQNNDDDLEKYKSTIIGWNQTYEYIFRLSEEIRNSLKDSTVGHQTLWSYFSRYGFFYKVINGKEPIGLSLIRSKLGGGTTKWVFDDTWPPKIIENNIAPLLGGLLGGIGGVGLLTTGIVFHKKYKITISKKK